MERGDDSNGDGRVVARWESKEEAGEGAEELRVEEKGLRGRLRVVYTFPRMSTRTCGSKGGEELTT